MDTLQHSITFPYVDSDLELEKFRTVVHLYHHTRKKDDSFWIHRQIDFSQRRAVGRLLASSEILMGNFLYRYELEGFMADSRLILVSRSLTHKERWAVMVFPDWCIGLSEDTGYYGISIHMDWNHKDGIDPTILIATPFEKATEIGQLNEEQSRFLDEHWKSLVPKVGICKYTSEQTPVDA